MKTANEQRPTARPIRRVLGTMYVGLVLTLLAVAVAILADHSGDIARQLRDAYPDWSAERVSENRSVVLIYLIGIGGVGAALWLWMAWAVSRAKRWARLVATGIFAVATMDALINLTQPQPTAVDLAGLAPCLAGLVAIALLWTRTAGTHFTKHAIAQTGPARRRTHVSVHRERDRRGATRTPQRTD
jgi:hypothetical protein